mmetsp:Transcript_20239/g.46407  ORF Transcript_20239/g.46407 Transcript_20239/m.46407 type:complete len:216 (+) Transcript_20239:102-749(+)
MIHIYLSPRLSMQQSWLHLPNSISQLPFSKTSHMSSNPPTPIALLVSPVGHHPALHDQPPEVPNRHAAHVEALGRREAVERARGGHGVRPHVLEVHPVPHVHLRQQHAPAEHVHAVARRSEDRRGVQGVVGGLGPLLLHDAYRPEGGVGTPVLPPRGRDDDGVVRRDGVAELPGPDRGVVEEEVVERAVHPVVDVVRVVVLEGLGRVDDGLPDDA